MPADSRLLGTVDRWGTAIDHGSNVGEMAGRYDTMLATAMTLGAGDERAARSASWRQIIDIVAQGGSALDATMRADAFARLTALRDDVDPAVRRFAAASLAGRIDDAAIVALFAADRPAVAAPLLARVELGAVAWQAIVPAMPAASRNLLRNRRDLPAPVVALLARFAPADLALAYAGPSVAAAGGSTQIRELVDRIEAYRSRVPAPAPTAALSAIQVHDAFIFEAGRGGLIDWIEDGPRACIIGIDLAQPAPIGEAGVDAGAAGAWRRRAPIRAARLMIAGEGAAAGDWRIDASPMFNPTDGRFTGYRGNARRPLPGEQAASAADPLVGVAPTALRQLIHELRTPLNAISGFAEMIDRQILGPADLEYRRRALVIVDEARRLIAMCDDLDLAARTDSGDRDPSGHDGSGARMTDAVPIVAAVLERHRDSWARRGIRVTLQTAPAVVAASSVAIDRMVARLLAASAALLTAGETLQVTIDDAAGMPRMRVVRPRAVAGRNEAALLDPEYAPDGDWPDAPLLGLGFTLRLVGRLVTQLGGRLEITADEFALVLPAVGLTIDEVAL